MNQEVIIKKTDVMPAVTVEFTFLVEVGRP